MGLSDVLFAVACTPAPEVRKKHHSTMAPLTLTVVATCSDLVLEQLGGGLQCHARGQEGWLAFLPCSKPCQWKPPTMAATLRQRLRHALIALMKPLVPTTVLNCCLWGQQKPAKLANPCCMLLQNRAA